jgi:hypothetical protein
VRAVDHELDVRAEGGPAVGGVADRRLRGSGRHDPVDHTGGGGLVGGEDDDGGGAELVGSGAELVGADAGADGGGVLELEVELEVGGATERLDGELVDSAAGVGDGSEPAVIVGAAAGSCAPRPAVVVAPDGVPAEPGRAGVP